MEKSRGLRLGSGETSDIYTPDPKDIPAHSPEQVVQLFEQHEFIPDAQLRFEATLESHGYQQVFRIEDKYEYPTLNEWVLTKLSRAERWIRSYPSFIKNKQDDVIYFCKARIKPLDPTTGSGFAREFTILSNNTDLPSPKLIGHISQDDASGGVELLIFEAIKISEGGVLLPQEWTSACAHEAVNHIKRFESKSIDYLPSRTLGARQIITEYVSNVEHILKEPLRGAIPEILSDFVKYDKPVFVHGDLWPKNVIASNDLNEPKILFVDWESAGAGFLGQDIGQLWWGLELAASEQVRDMLVAEFLAHSTEKTARQTILKFGIILEALHSLDERRSRLERYTDPSLTQRFLGEIEDIHVQFDNMLKRVETA